ncbi:MAG: DUF4355 domain-containing protein [Lachnospiraceae bacterium]|nr:DUF4355 domain-containing protein [Lachnospiraceae bacterium]
MKHKNLKKFRIPMAMNLQLFADDPANPADPEGGDPADPADPEGDDPEGKKKGAHKPKYSKEDLNRIISRKIAEERKKSDKSAKEAQRLASMSADERMQSELKETKSQLEELRHQNAIDKMAKVARGILADRNINLPDDLLFTMVTEDSKETKANVDSFAKLFDKAVANAVADKLKGKTPRTGGPAHSLTKSDIDKITDRRERQRAIKENMNLFIGGN